MKKKVNVKKILIIVGGVVLVLAVVQLIVLGSMGGIGPLKFIRNNRMAKEPGNAEEYRLEHVQPMENSPLQGKNLLFLGSSVTYGSASMGVSMADYIEVLDSCEVVKEAASGTTLSGSGGSTYVSRLKKVDKTLKLDAVICQLSTNDASQKKPLGAISDSYQLADFDTETIIGAIEYIIGYTQETWGCPLIMYTGTKFDSEAYQAMVDALPALQEKWGIGIIDLWNDEEMNQVSAEDYALYMNDGVHPTQAGYLHWWVPKFEAYLYDFLSNNQ